MLCTNTQEQDITNHNKFTSPLNTCINADLCCPVANKNLNKALASHISLEGLLSQTSRKTMNASCTLRNVKQIKKALPICRFLPHVNFVHLVLLPLAGDWILEV